MQRGRPATALSRRIALSVEASLDAGRVLPRRADAAATWGETAPGPARSMTQGTWKFRALVVKTRPRAGSKR